MQPMVIANLTSVVQEGTRRWEKTDSIDPADAAFEMIYDTEEHFTTFVSNMADTLKLSTKFIKLPLIFLGLTICVILEVRKEQTMPYYYYSYYYYYYYYYCCFIIIIIIIIIIMFYFTFLLFLTFLF